MIKRIILLIQSSMSSSFFKDSMWALIGNIVYRGSGLLSSILLAKILLSKTYGEFNSLKNTLTTLAIFTTFGLAYSSTKFVSDCISGTNTNPRYIIKQIYKIVIIFSGAIGLLIFIRAKNVSELYYNDISFSNEIRLLSFWIILTAMTTVQNGVIAGLKIFKKFTFINIAIGIVSVIIIPLLAYYYSLYGACIGLLFVQLIIFIVNEYYIAVELKSYKGDLSVIKYKRLISYSFPLTMIEAVYSISLWFCYYVLQNNTDYHQVAIYSTAMQWYVLILFIPIVLKNVILSHFSEENSQFGIFRKAIILSFVSTFIPVVIIFMLSDMIQNLYGTSFGGLSHILKIMVLIPIFSCVSGVIEQYLFSKSRNWLVFSISLFKDFGSAILSYYFIHLRISDAAFYVVLSYLLFNILSFFFYIIIFFKLKRAY